MTHSMNTIDRYGTRKAADNAYKNTVKRACSLTREDGNEYFVCIDDDGAFFVGTGFQADMFDTVASTYDLM